MRERTIALVMTGGTAEGKFAERGLKYKARFPVNGRPLVDYILCALQASTVEKVFILQPADADLQTVVTPHAKNVFLNYDEREHSIGLTMGRAIEHLLDYHGVEALHERTVMWLPCDIPLVRTEDVDSLIAGSRQPEMDALFTIIPHRVLTAAYPDRRFPSLYLSDRGERYSLQSVMFVDGRHYNYATSPEYAGVRLAVTDAYGEPIPGLVAGIDGMRDGRHGVFNTPRFIYEVVIRRMLRRGLLTAVPRGLYELATGKLTTASISDYLFLAMRVRFGAVMSASAAYSADVDSPEDAERCLELRPDR
jgi:molybdopterin-guanine dinucleotide biosynthesis protein A